MTPRTHYEILGLPMNATQAEIRSAFRKLALIHHPDRSSDPNATEMFMRISDAYEVLSDPAKRRAYDSVLETRMRGAWQPEAPPPKPPPPAPSKPKAAPTNRMNADLIKLAALYNKGKYDDAEQLAQLILERDARLAIPYGILGDIARARGQTNRAIKMYAKAVQLDHKNPLYQRRHDEMNVIAAAGVSGQTAHSPRSTATAGVGIFLVLLGLVYVAISREAALAPNLGIINSWTLGLVVMLFLAGVIAGASLSLAAILDRFSSVNVTALGKISPSLALGSIAVVNFWAAAALYVVLGVAQNSFNYSTSRLIATVGAIVGLMGVAAAVSPTLNPLQVLLWGGNLVYIGSIAGWMVVDSLR